MTFSAACIENVGYAYAYVEIELISTYGSASNIVSSNKETISGKYDVSDNK
jgi:hypothetical protein